MTRTYLLQHGDLVTIDGDTWKIVGIGAKANERVYLHVAHTSRGTQGKAGFIPVQSCGWYDGQTLHDRDA